MSVTLAGHGVRKKQPICSSGRPVFFTASALARAAAVSMGDFRGSTWSHRSGKRTRMSRTTAGQAELITGRVRQPWSQQLAGGLAHQLGGPGDLKHIVKPQRPEAVRT